MTQATQTFEATPPAASAARRFVHSNSTLDSMRHSEAQILISEIVGNLLRHSKEATNFTVEIDQPPRRDLSVAVSHQNAEPIETSESGLGFLLLERLSKEWGTSYDDGNASVWFKLRSPGAATLTTEVSNQELIDSVQDGARYVDALIRRHNDLTKSIARRYRSKGIDEDDLEQVARFALFKAITRYDPAMGPLRPYAAATISGELKRYLRDRGWSVRVPRSLQERSLAITKAAQSLAQENGRIPSPSALAERLDLDEDEVLEGLLAAHAFSSESTDAPIVGTERTILDRLSIDDPDHDLWLTVAQAIELLPERQRTILRLRFGEDMTQSEIASEVGLSQMHISRLLTKSLETIRASLTGPDID